MSQYIQINPDGSRVVVKYDPHHDGPVSERLTLTRKQHWLARQLKRWPKRPDILAAKLKTVSRQISALDFQRQPPQKRHHRPTHHRRFGPRLDTRDDPPHTEAPVNLESAPASGIATAGP